jgi:hypothetical protein
LIQRKCGTCKYFEEGGIAASGWCRHPERQALEHMVLVRKTELACRDGWDDDLWEPKDDRAGSGRSRRNQPAKQRLPAQPADVRDSSLPEAARQTRSTASGGPSGSAESSSSEPHDRSEVGVPGNWPGQDEGSRVDAALSAWSSALRKETRREEPEDELKAETVSLRTDLRNSGWRRDLEFGATSGVQQTPEQTPDPAREVVDENGRNRLEELPRVSAGSEPSDQMNARVVQSGQTEPIEFTEPEAAPAGSGRLESGADVSANGFDQSGASIEADDAELPLVAMVAQANACCRNCRDYIPKDGGWRGWCSNPYAFEKRRLVDGDSIACQSTLGTWWSPSDDWWLERADIAHHSAPTPLVDNLIREIRIRQLESEGSTDTRNRS